jgi:negative regulator of flagellin synthesis FlgM
MKISSTSEPLRPDRMQPPSKDARAKSSEGASPAAAGETEKVQVSDMAAKLAKLESRFGDEFDTRKIDEVRDAISEGRFQVNSGAVADKLIASVGELLNRKA